MVSNDGPLVNPSLDGPQDNRDRTSGPLARARHGGAAPTSVRTSIKGYDTIAAMPTVSDHGLLYTALMLRKLHELRGFGSVLDAGAEGRYRAVLGEHLPGAVWLGIEEAWAPVLGEFRLRRRGEGLGPTDIRVAAASRHAGVGLALFEDVFEHLEPDDAVALAAAWLEHGALVLVAAPAELPVATALPGLCARFVQGDGAVCLLAAEAERARQVSQLHGMIPAIVRRMAGAA